MFIKRGHSAQTLIRILKIPSSTWYQRRATQMARPAYEVSKKSGRKTTPTKTESGELLSDAEVVTKIKSLRGQEFFDKMGYRKLLPFLKRDEGLIINHKKLFRIYSQANMCLPKKKKQKRQGKKICENRVVTGPNQLWQFDIKYGYIDGDNRFFFLMAFIDVFNRKVVEYHVGLRCQAKDILAHLELALEKPGVDPSKLVIRSDNGPQMTSSRFKMKVEELGLEHEFTPPSTPNLNAYVESFFSIVDREFLQGRSFKSYGEAYEATTRFINHYNKIRPHGSLKNMAPEEFTRRHKEDKNQCELAA